MIETFRVTHVLVVVCLIFTLVPAYAQSLKDHLQKADRYYEKKDYENALKYFIEALALDPDNPLTNYKAGVSSLDQNQYPDALRYLQKASQMKPDVDPDIDYHLGMAYQSNHQYAEARTHFESLGRTNKRLAPIMRQKIAECIAGDSLMKLPVSATVRSLRDDFNTSFSEFAPLVSADGQTFIFSSNRSSDAYEIKSGTNLDDVYISQKQGTDWTAPQKIHANINVRPNEVATSISADGTTLVLYYEDGGGDIYTSTKENGVWSKPVPLNRFINHPAYRESAACISADGKRLFFSSDRPGGKGGFDIYVSELSANGQWGRPSNLGSPVNTRKDELSPFIDAEGATLYFSSDGHPTLGGQDLFSSTFLNGRWSSPGNLGYPVNSRGDEGFITLSPGKESGYFSSRRKPGQTDTDIYSVTFTSGTSAAGTDTPEGNEPEGNEPESGIFTRLSGTVIDVTDARPLQATVTLVDNASKEIVAKSDTDISGSFQLAIPRGGNYGLRTEKDGYLFNSMHFDLPPFEKYQEIDTHILMVKAAVGSKVILKNTFFDVGQATLRKESLSELENIRDLLVRNPHWRVRINGHTDNVGQPEANRALSLKRAEAVVHYLIRQGIEPARLEAKGFGSERPLVSNDDDREGRQINRRTEIEIIQQ